MILQPGIVSEPESVVSLSPGVTQVTLVKVVDKLSPTLLQAVATGTTFNEVDFVAFDTVSSPHSKSAHVQQRAFHQPLSGPEWPRADGADHLHCDGREVHTEERRRGSRTRGASGTGRVRWPRRPCRTARSRRICWTGRTASAPPD